MCVTRHGWQKTGKVVVHEPCLQIYQDHARDMALCQSEEHMASQRQPCKKFRQRKCLWKVDLSTEYNFYGKGK